ncbi:DUF1153 domain-containing protein [Sphingopyxis sp. LARHCG72]
MPCPSLHGPAADLGPLPPSSGEYRLARRSQRTAAAHATPHAAAALPPQDVKRWTTSRKALLVSAIDSGSLNFIEACKCYAITPEELAHWCQRYHRAGKAALRVTQTQHYRGGV